MSADMSRIFSFEDVCVVILTLNEEQTLETAIRSVRWSSEVWVVDSGSSDRTIEIAQHLGARTLAHVQEGPFLISEQRNWAVDHIETSREWILFLDADEAATDAFARAVLDGINSPSRPAALYAAPAFMYHNTWLKRSSGYPNWHPRILRRTGRVRFTGGVWEDFASDGVVGKVVEPYIHRTNAKGLSDWIEKHDRYARWEAERILSVADEPPDSRRGSLRALRYRLGPVRKFAAIAYQGLVRRGLLDGPEGLSYMKRMFIYELMIDEHLREKRRIQAHQQL
jgi:glycosyltransferase involved in cell wall biosynthesis